MSGYSFDVKAGSDEFQDLKQYLDGAWDKLLKGNPRADTSGKSGDAIASSFLRMPREPFIAPGGRFREVYYWDTYFSIIGMLESPERYEVIENMLVNF